MIINSNKIIEQVVVMMVMALGETFLNSKVGYRSVVSKIK